MGTTTRHGLPFPELTDEPNGPAALQALAGATGGWLNRAFPCLSTARPSLTAADDGFLIRETDTGAVRMWDGANWTTDLRGSASSGGDTGGGTPTPEPAGKWAQYSASSAQSVSSNQVTACAFGVADSTDAAVSRGGRSGGHQFTLQASGIWTVTTTVRFADSSSQGERYVGLHWAADTAGGDEGDPLKGAGSGSNASGPVTHNVSETRWFDAGDALYVSLWNGTSGTRKLEPGPDGDMGKGWVRINFALVAT